MHTAQYALYRQSGMVLIISLIMLVLLTIIGVSGMKVTALEEKMAGNDRDQSISFQAAETALRIGEAQARAIYKAGNLENFCDGTLSSAAGQQGLFYEPSINDGRCIRCPVTPNADCDIPNPMNADTWTSDTMSVAVPNKDLLKGTQAHYYITYHYFYRNKGPDQTIDSYYFTVTARGAGAKGGEVVLRSYFGGKIPL